MPAPDTIYRGARKLPPGTILRASRRQPAGRHAVSGRSRTSRARARARASRGSEDEAAEALDALLRDAVRRRMIADVPLGAFLSGGIDSSTVVALMQAQSTRPVRTFSIGFHEAEFNESEHAAAVARHLGTEHTELYAEPRHALDVIPQLADMYDEPFADSSQIPTYLVSKMTRAHVTVALSGDGGDELFAGYTRYFRGEASVAAHRRHAATAARARRRAASGRCRRRPGRALGDASPSSCRPAQFGDKMHKLAGVLAGEPDASAFYRQMVSHVGRPGGAGRRRARTARAARRCADRSRVMPDFVERMQYLDTLTYLPDDILTKVDRASMAVALEARVPLLDHRVVEFSLVAAARDEGPATASASGCCAACSIATCRAS